jgi:3-phosphoshikimate 1-carboxyvinyltransferase
MRIQPVRHFRGRFRPGGDKSISHRLALFGAMADGETRLTGFSNGADPASTLACLEALGVEIARRGDAVRIAGRGYESFRAPGRDLDAGNSGSTLRMLAGVLAGRPFRSTLTGDASLCQRPVERIAAPLRAMGARVESSSGRPPLTIEGGALRSLTWDSPVASAQVKSAVLLAGVQAEGTTRVREPGPSRDHTERWLPAFGVPVEVAPGEAWLRGPARLRAPAHALRIPGDVSSAAFLVVAALVLPDSEVTIEGVLLNPRRAGFLEVLRRMGAQLEVELEESDPEPVGTLRARSSRLGSAEIDPRELPGLIDEVPALAAAAACGDGELVVTGAAELRVKESDRIAALAAGLGALGARVEEQPDGLRVGSAPLRGARVDARHDHRIAMALAVAALRASGETEIDGAGTAAVSFPEFFELLRQGAA